LTIDVMRQVTGDYVARITRVMKPARSSGTPGRRLTDITSPILVAEYRGETPGTAIDRACDGVHGALGIAI
jgi:hypothetical protein